MDNASLIGIVGQLFFICIVLLVLMNLMKAKQKSQQHEEIQKLLARLANLRIILKAKIKKKSNYYRNVFPQTVNVGDMIDTALMKIVELKFDSGADFQSYVDTCKVVNQYLKVSLDKFEKEILVMETKQTEAALAVAAAVAAAKEENAGENLAASAPVPLKKLQSRRTVEFRASQIELEGPYNFMTPDMKTEFSIIKMIDEIVGLVLKIKEKVNAYNRENPKKPLPVVAPIEFPSLADIRRIYNENSELKSASAETIPENIAS